MEVFVRCTLPGWNQKLAWALDKLEHFGRAIAIETRGEGGYAVVGPSLHPSGKLYAWLSPMTVVDVPTVSQEHAERLLAAARALDEDPGQRLTEERSGCHVREETVPGQARGHEHASVIGTFNASHSLESALERFGYFRGSSGRYIRPGGKSESVSLENGRSTHWSSNDPLNNSNSKSGCSTHDAFDFYAHFEHAGDKKKAVRAVAKLLGLNGVNSVNVNKTPRHEQKTRSFDDAAREYLMYTPFPLNVLPKIVQQFVRETAEAIGCDHAYVVLPLLSMLAAAIGNSRRVRLKSSWTEPPVLWTAIVADSGTSKSPAFDAALAAVRQRQKRSIRDYERALAEYLELKANYDAAMRARRHNDLENRGEPMQAPNHPVWERFLCSDATVEAMAERWALHPAACCSRETSWRHGFPGSISTSPRRRGRGPMA